MSPPPPPEFYFDADQGNPSPGFRLGFPVIQVSAGKFLLISPSGRRSELRQIADGSYQSVDSSNLQLLTGGGGQLLLRAPDGTQFTYVMVNGEYRCTGLKDRNGNYQSVAYNDYGRMTRITDTLGRVINFNYDANNRLLSLTQPRGAATHTWATFGYGSIIIRTAFDTGYRPVAMNGGDVGSEGNEGNMETGGLTDTTNSYVNIVGPQNDTAITVLTQVGLQDGSSYRFEYNSWGQVTTIKRFAADGHLLTSTTYNLPADNSTALADCPRFTERRDFIENWNDNLPALTKFAGGTDSSGQPWVGISRPDAPDSIVYKEYYSHDWGGLLLRTENYDPANLATPQKVTTTEWTQDNPRVNYQDNPRPTLTKIIDSAGNVRQTAYNYTSYGLISDIYEPKGRRTHIDYNLSAAYVGKRIIGLPKETYLFDGQQLVSKVSFKYDEGTIYYDGPKGTPVAPSWHDAGYGTDYTVRGNRTSMTRWDVNAENDEAQAVTSRAAYNVAGTVAYTQDAAGHRVGISYLDSYIYSGGALATGAAINEPGIEDPAASGNKLPSQSQTLAYPTKVTDADVFSSTSKYDYYLGAVVRAQGPPPQGAAEGAIQTTSYDRAGRMRQASTFLNSSDERNNNPYRYTQWVYPVSQTVVNTFTTVNSLSNLAYMATVLDGAGRVRATAQDLPNSPVGRYGGQYTAYDVLGRTERQYRPTEMSNLWAATGDDSQGWAYTFQTYDWKSRPLRTINPDNTDRLAEYGGCGCAGEETVTLSSETVPNETQGTLGRRRQKTYQDVLGRTIKKEVLNWDGIIYSTTVTDYNARDQVVSVKSYKGKPPSDASCPSGTCQLTTMTYDGHGRLKTQKSPNQTIASTYSYNLDDTLLQGVDARGVTSDYTYNNRHLVTGVNHLNPTGHNVAVSNTFGYDATGRRTTMADKAGAVNYQYDILSRISSETRTFTALNNASYTLAYTYNLADKLTSVTDPTQSRIDYGYDNVGRLKDVTPGSLDGGTGTPYGNVTEYATAMRYRAWGALKEVNYGNGFKLSNDYNLRQQISHYNLGNPTTQNAGVIPPVGEYDYYADGRIKQTTDRSDATFNRVYKYDHVGRLSEARTDSQAYSQKMDYDVWGHLTGSVNDVWRYGAGTSNEYLNGRTVRSITVPRVYPNNNPPQYSYWTHDAEGRVKRDHNKEYTYDAEGNKTLVFETTEVGVALTQKLWIYQDYDAEGRRAKRVEQRQINLGAYSFVTSYYVRSTVLGGRVVTELNEHGQKRYSNVYANGSILAKQQDNQVRWEHVDPVTGTRRESDAAGNGGVRAEFDALGNEIPVTDPQPPESTNYDYVGNYDGGGNAYDASTGCAVDGQQMPCYLVMRAYNQGKPGGLGGGGGVASFSHVWVDEWEDWNIKADLNVFEDGGTSGSRNVGYFLTIQAKPGTGSPNSTPVPFPGRDAVRNRINTGDCNAYIASLIAKAAELSNGKKPAVAQDGLDLLSKINDFQLVVGLKREGYQIGGTVSGSIANKDATVLIDARFMFGNNRHTIGKWQAEYLETAIHEILHLAGYTDRELAVAASHLPGAVSKLPPPPAEPRKENGKWIFDMNGILDNSRYYNDELMKHCGDKSK